MDEFVVKRSRELREDSSITVRHWMQGKMLIMAALRSRCGHYIFVPFFICGRRRRRVHVYHTYLIAAIEMTFRVLEGHLHIARIFKCDFRIFGTSHGSSASAELLVLNVVLWCWFQWFTQWICRQTAPSSRNQSQWSSVTYLLLQLHRRQCPLAVPVSAAEGNLRSLLAFRVDPEDDVECSEAALGHCRQGRHLHLEDVTERANTIKLLKSYLRLRSTMTDDRLTGLALMYIHLQD